MRRAALRTPRAYALLLDAQVRADLLARGLIRSAIPPLNAKAPAGRGAGLSGHHLTGKGSSHDVRPL